MRKSPSAQQSLHPHFGLLCRADTISASRQYVYVTSVKVITVYRSVCLSPLVSASFEELISPLGMNMYVSAHQIVDCLRRQMMMVVTYTGEVHLLSLLSTGQGLRIGMVSSALICHNRLFSFRYSQGRAVIGGEGGTLLYLDMHRG